MMIREEDCDVEDLELVDLEEEADHVQALYILEQVSLAKLGMLFSQSIQKCINSPSRLHCHLRVFPRNP